ncbi:MAG TPA: phytanoyl-CoA dioxygenase family protein [Pyrinomonadaceae bacterium]
MDDWYNVLNARSGLSASTLQELNDAGFVVIPGPSPADQMPQFADAYDLAVASAATGDISVGSSTTRVNDFVNRGPEFDQLYVYEPILTACCGIIAQPFKLSTMHARAVRRSAVAQALHVDYGRDDDGWPMVGFILMIDEFRSDNGATRFVPGSHKWPNMPNDTSQSSTSERQDEVLACGPAGSVIIYNGATWHGHSENRTEYPRRSLQGAFIRRNAEAAVKQSTRIRPETLQRIGNLQKYLLELD